MTENTVELLPALLARARALTSGDEEAEALVERCLFWAIDQSDEFPPPQTRLDWLLAILEVLATDEALSFPRHRKSFL
ncbi:hypothetical protein [Paracoccus aminovorans]|uniref:hypothetical protein n=1 Tax=Paracoccus aminovorans TaxID=34004 RepID=UPI002B256623|nr:hypothetical protein [Paracoccus aminovorans]